MYLCCPGDYMLLRLLVINQVSFNLVDLSGCVNIIVRVFRLLFTHLPSVPLPSVLWRCWLGGRKGIRL